MISKTSFRRPEVGLYLRFLRERFVGGCVDMVGGTIPSSIRECGWSRAIVGKLLGVGRAAETSDGRLVAIRGQFDRHHE